ncbi:MAG: hypothetical protein KME07_06545 [Pegethrix bostrychoides GSE-TBD4-15B]|jgi:hypothetical protein|uniref:Uncharacterized protein n=1 Tax=Pegethrix bostrychoides GSE-TBD4-15B TaxID=2839662 RepID=A0A951PAG8_9CYAN|nr:hypothetical protein [Pegethrix bostrychoides GSE-TBD4-15B]
MPRAKVVQDRLTFGFVRILAFIGGVVVGYFGAIPARLIFYALLGNLDYRATCSMASYFSTDCQEGLSQMFNLFSTVGRFIGIIFMVLKFSDMQDKFLYIQNLKVMHRKLYFKVRNYFYEPYSKQLDIFWSILYVLFETILPLATVLISWSIVFSVFYSLIGWFSIILCFIGSSLIYDWVSRLLYMMLFPHRLEQEVREASLNNAVLEAKEQEERRDKSRLKHEESKYEELDGMD